MAYHVDRLYAAVSVLAGHGHIKQRLITAYEEHIDGIRDTEMPPAAQEGFGKLRQRMHRVAPLNGEGPICASVRKMSVQEASACAASIVEMYREATRHETESRPRRRAKPAAKSVPPFLVNSN